jgi:glycosyltransferase involved in cell wall biosynthesis
MIQTHLKSTHFLSLIIPAYRQEKTIFQNVTSIQSVLTDIRYDYEIIVVVDGVMDRTYHEMRKKKLFDDKKIKFVLYKKNYGKAYAIRSGMHLAKGDYVMFLDSGQEIDPNGISMLLEHMEWYGADVIVGSKRHLASMVIYPWERRILSYGYYLLVKFLFGIKIHDTQAGIKIFRKQVLRKIMPFLYSEKFAGDLEMLVVADSFGFKKIYEAPIKLDYQFSNITSAATFKSIVGILIDTMAIFYRKNIKRSYK